MTLSTEIGNKYILMIHSALESNEYYYLLIQSAQIQLIGTKPGMINSGKHLREANTHAFPLRNFD